MRRHKYFVGIIFTFVLLGILSVSHGYIIPIHPDTMNITNSSGYTNNYNPDIIAYKVNDNITFKALAPNSIAQDILNKGVIKWDFGDLTETDYGSNITVKHRYSFPFPYPVSWCGYLNNTGYSKALTYNWLVVGDISNTKYIFNGSPSNSKTSWDVVYNSSNNTVIIKYYSENTTNMVFNGLSVDTTIVSVNVSNDDIVEGDSVKFSYSVSRNIIFTVWCFGDGSFSFEKSPTHTYSKPGIYYPRVLVIDEYGRVMVGYLDEGIKVNKPMGGYFEPVRNMNYVYNSSGAVNVEDMYAMAYKVNDTITFKPDYSHVLDYVKYNFGDGSETDYYSPYTIFSHKYSYPFIYPICWMSIGNGWTAFSATLDYLVVGDVGNTIYEFIPNNTYTTTPKVDYDSKNHIVKFYFYSDNIDNNVTLKLKQKVHNNVVVKATETNNGIKYSFEYPYGKPVFVFWNFGDGSYSLENSPTHIYPNGNNYYQAYVLIVDENGVVSVGFGPVIEENIYGNVKIGSMLYILPTIVKVNDTVNVNYIDPDVDSETLELYPEDYNYNSLGNIYLEYYWGNWHIISDKIYYPNLVLFLENNVTWDPTTYTLTLPFKFLKEGIYYIEGYDDFVHYVPRLIKVINNHNPVAKLYAYPNPASYNENIFFNPLNSYDPDAGRTLSDGSGYVISPDEPPAKIYGFDLTIYNASGNVVWDYSANELKIVYHKFPPGNYTAVLTVWDGMGGMDSTTINFTVINTPPVAEFTYSPKYPNVNEKVTFDASKSYDIDGKITKYVWNFGDGTNLTTLNPIVSHTYNKTGTYTVTLTVYDELNASSSISKTITVGYIKANFSYAPEIPKVNSNIIFTDKSISIPGNIIRWHWDFGDGTTSTQQNPTHRYSKEGAYYVTLTVWNDLNMSDSVTKVLLIRGPSKYPPVAIFTFTINGSNVTFNASKSYDIDGKIVKYIWDFGDGTNATTSSPIISHKYNGSKIYLVKLTVVDDDNLTGTTERFVNIGNSEKSVPIPLPVEILILITTILSINYIMRRLK